MRIRTIDVVVLGCALLAGAAQAEKGPETGVRERQFVEMSGFEGQEAALGTAVAETIMELSPTNSPRHDFSDDLRAKRLGHAVSTAIRTINVDTPYMHEMNDALVKMILNHIQFAKDRGLVDEIVAEEMRTQFPMLSRVRKLIEKTGDKTLAVKAITDRTACFYQLVEDARREPGKITYKSPFGVVLAQSRKIGQHNLTEKEIHEIWTIPRVKGWAEIMGVEILVSEWSDDGIITISLPEDERVAYLQ